jgi:hypothetical protein
MSHIAIAESLDGKQVAWLERSAMSSTASSPD